MIFLTLNQIENLVLTFNNVQYDLSFVLNIKIKFLRIENTLFRVMRSLLFLINIKRLYVCNDVLIKYIIVQLFKINKRDSQNLCSKTVLIKIKKILIIYRLKK